MAAPKNKAQSVASAQWVQSERDQARQFIDEEVEEFSFSVRNELEWLDEHMGDIFSRNQMNFADAFKTPGKLRGKTPRTARKAGAPRQPLTDIFAPNGQNAQPSAHKTTKFYDKVAHFQIAEDADNQHRPASRSKSPQRIGKPGNTDSGYHGMTEDEMEAETQGASTQHDSQETVASKSLEQEGQQQAQQNPEENEGNQQRSARSSFVSVKWSSPRHDVISENVHDDAGDAMEFDEPQGDVENQAATAEADQVKAGEAVDEEPVDEDMMDETAPSPSETSSPEKPLQRKSSFTFSALPAREPLTAKRSIGVRDSQLDVERNSVFARSLTGKSMGAVANESPDDEQGKAEEAKLQSKTSTQLLQERISMLGKAKEPRMSKSIPQSVMNAQVAYPQLPSGDALGSGLDDVEMQDEVAMGGMQADDDEDEDDWIAPVKPAQHRQLEALNKEEKGSVGSPQRPGMHQKSISASNIPSATKTEMAQDTRTHQKATSVSNPNLAYEYQSTTPAGSPVHKKQHDGALSASKSKLYSVFKSARSIFASSASASAAAKLDAHAQSPSRSPARGTYNDSGMAGMYNMPGAMYSDAQLPPSPTRTGSVFSALSKSPSRKTRSSTESKRKQEKETKAQEKAEQELEKAREKERQTAAKQREEERKAAEAEAAKQENEKQQAVMEAERPASADSEQARDDMPPPPPPKSMLPAGKLRAPGRLAKPTKEMPRSKPAPVSIRVASQSQRMGQPQSSVNAGREESMPPAPPPKQERPASGLRTASAQGTVRSSTAPNNARVKALEAAARKKELEEKAAQRKAEQKREIERKRAAKAEEDRRMEQERKVEEQKRAQEAKLAAQRQAEKQAAEARRREQQRQEQERQRLEQQRALEQQRQHEASQKAKAAHDLAEAIQRERAQGPTQHPRGDVGGTLRQLSKNMATVQPNPAKPPKRVLQQEDEEHAPQRPGMQRAPPSYQQNEAKRRKTNEEEQQHDQRNSVMAPPKRPSNMRKETLTKFPHGYSHAPPPASHNASNMFKATVTSQHQLQHSTKPGQMHPSQMVQHSNARIPFAENPNPAGHHQGYPQPQQQLGQENPYQANKFKTPARPAPSAKQAVKSAVKSSPLYPNGDGIALPEIATDSEDEEDSEDEAAGGGGFRAPSWVASPALRELLTQQQLVDPETVFGPIGELRMEEVFKGGKNQERLKRFRDRGSSAAWVETGDAVTSAEKRRDMEMRERVVKEGGWRYEPGA
ncbi:hypothetical protein MBLNU230_g4113t2 [Neophaeotheca triangularis]